MSFDEINAIDLGERLRIQREVAGLTQADVAEAINIARTTLVAMEKGDRRIKPDEIQKLAGLYKTSVNALLRRESVFVDLLPRFRKLETGSDAAADNAAQLLTELVRAETELENILGITRAKNYPPERPLLPGNVKIQAEADAIELRNWLGLGSSPIRDIVTILEMDMGVRVYVRRLEAHISGLFAYDDTLGACILLNANHSKERRNHTAAHELGHFISARKVPDVLHTHGLDDSREERYADHFARAFLTPVRLITQKFQEVTAGSPSLTRRHIILLSHALGVSREGIVRRLEELGLAHPGTWDWFESHGGITKEHVEQVLGDLDTDPLPTKQPSSLRLNLLAAEAHRRGFLTESQLSRLLHLNRIDFRKILDAIEIEGMGGNELPKLPG